MITYKYFFYACLYCVMINLLDSIHFFGFAEKNFFEVFFLDFSMSLVMTFKKLPLKYVYSNCFVSLD